MANADNTYRYGKIPRHVRAAVLRRAHGFCEECEQPRQLEVHHLRYWNDHGEPITGRETPDDLAALCRDCHHGRHVGPDGGFYTDPEEVAAEWDYFDHLMDSDI